MNYPKEPKTRHEDWCVLDTDHAGSCAHDPAYRDPSKRQYVPAFPASGGMNAVITGINSKPQRASGGGIVPNANHLAVRFLDLLSAADRKEFPIATGALDYFPDAIAAIARVSKVGNDQHNPGEPLHWSRGKSDDQADTILRHLASRGTIDTDGIPHSWKALWRCAALVQKEIEYFAEAARDAGLPFRPGLPPLAPEGPSKA